MQRSMQLEWRRLEYLRSRDGDAAAQVFARRTYRQYRQALGSGYGAAYRRELLASCLVFRRHLRGHRQDSTSAATQE